MAAELLLAILEGELLPGEPIRQDEWAARLDVSKVPFREALKLLGARHLIRYSPNRGYFVPKMAVAELSQIYEIRGFLETAVLETLRWPTEGELAELRSMSERAILAAEAGNVASFLQEEEGLFFALFDLSPQTVYVREAKHFWKLCDQYRAAALVTNISNDPTLDRLREQRASFLQAIEARDHEALVVLVGALRDNLVRLLHFPSTKP